MTVDIESRVRQANPLTRDEQLEQLFGEDASRRLLRAIRDRRGGRMTEQTQDEQTPQVVPDSAEVSRTRRLRTRINPAVAIAAFLVVIAVGITLAIAFRAGEPDVVSPQSLAASYLEARDARDAEAALALFAVDAEVEDSGTTLAEQASLFEWFEVINHRWTVGECIETTAGPPAQVTCTITHHNAWTDAMGLNPISGSFDFSVENGRIVTMTNNFNFDDFGPVWDRMQSWIAANGYAPNAMFNSFQTNPRFDAESMLLWKQATEQFVAEQEARG